MQKMMTSVSLLAPPTPSLFFQPFPHDWNLVQHTFSLLDNWDQSSFKCIVEFVAIFLSCWRSCLGFDYFSFRPYYRYMLVSLESSLLRTSFTSSIPASHFKICYIDLKIEVNILHFIYNQKFEKRTKIEIITPANLIRQRRTEKPNSTSCN